MRFSSDYTRISVSSKDPKQIIRDLPPERKIQLLKYEDFPDSKVLHEASRRFREQAETLPYKLFNPADLIATQPYVYRDYMVELIERGVPNNDSQGTSPTDEPYVVRYSGKNYLLDGNHRAAWHLLYGVPIKARFWDER